jgi:hypothetical protein
MANKYTSAWTDQEIEVLKSHYANSDRHALVAYLPSYSYSQIRRKAKSLGVRRTFKDTTVCRRGHRKACGERCKICFDAYQKQFVATNPDYYKDQNRIWRANHVEERNAYDMSKRLEYRAEWLKWFEQEYGQFPTCRICERRLIWDAVKCDDRICFDHRRGHEIVTKSPRTWIQNKPCTEDNKKIFLSCDFGILCNRCNLMLPNDLSHRKRVASNILDYIKS